MPARITLSMIVKNEAHVVARCLESVKPLLTSWLVVDTGSTDGTQDVVRATMAGIPGELHERPWKDFAHNRNEAIELARGKGDYLLVIDADDLLVVPEAFTMPELGADGYRLLVEDGGMRYWRTQLFRSDLDYRYTGVLHEVLTSGSPRNEVSLEGIVYRRTTTGARSADPHKFEKDAAVLEAALAKEPGNARYAFYLAQSWRDAGKLDKALAAYERRAGMAGFEEEKWTALLEVAKLHARLGHGEDVVVGAYLRAFERRPTRAESLCYLAMYLRDRNRIVAAYPFARTASEIARPDDILFLDESVYAWRALDEYAVAAYWMGRYRESLEASERLLAGSALPASERERVQQNVRFSREKLKAARG